MPFSGTESRKTPRINCHFIVHYRNTDEGQHTDVSQLKNLSLGGALFTSSQYLEKGSVVVLKIKLPNSFSPIVSSAKVIESHEIVKGLIYDTRVAFSPLQQYDSEKLSHLVGDFLNNPPRIGS